MMVKKKSKSSTNTDIFSKNGQIQFEANQPGPQSPKPLSQKTSGEKRQTVSVYFSYTSNQIELNFLLWGFFLELEDFSTETPA